MPMALQALKPVKLVQVQETSSWVPPRDRFISVRFAQKRGKSTLEAQRTANARRLLTPLPLEDVFPMQIPERFL